MPRGVHGNHSRGSSHHRWNASAIVSEHGYRKVRVGKDHALADTNGYAYEHLIVWAASGAALPTEDEVIHHRNGDKTDNRIENLEVLARSDHNRVHNAERSRDDRGRFTS